MGFSVLVGHGQSTLDVIIIISVSIHHHWGHLTTSQQWVIYKVMSHNCEFHEFYCIVFPHESQICFTIGTGLRFSQGKEVYMCYILQSGSSAAEYIYASSWVFRLYFGKNTNHCVFFIDIAKYQRGYIMLQDIIMTIYTYTERQSTGWTVLLWLQSKWICKIWIVCITGTWECHSMLLRLPLKMPFIVFFTIAI